MIRSLAHEGLIWFDIEHLQKEDVESLAEKYGLHPLNVEDSLSKRQLSKIDDHGNHIFVLYHFPVYTGKSMAIAPSQVSFFVGNDFLISVHEPELGSMGRLFQACEQDPTRRAGVMKSSARLLYHIADALADDLFPFLQKVEENLELISDKVFDERQSVAVQLSSQRRTIGDLRRIISPLRRLATDSASKLQRFSGHEDLSEYFDDVTDHVEKAWEILEGTKETIEIYKDTDNILSLELTNKVLVNSSHRCWNALWNEHPNAWFPCSRTRNLSGNLHDILDRNCCICIAGVSPTVLLQKERLALARQLTLLLQLAFWTIQALS
ncbi:MAG: magnesium transporter CorA family protein [Thaumarchaeota archaeon]|nr:magnesium transporter CorA family protein [Nitrososphaerota archaeon]